ncbi:hypothetical protein VPH35_041162 [Triticum aestivum]
MITTSNCPICESDCGSVRHSFFRCNRVKEIWAKLGLNSTINELCEAESEGSSVLGDLLLMPNAAVPSFPGMTRKELVAVAVWYIWWERRCFNHGEAMREPARSAQAIVTLTKNFMRSRKQGVTRIQRYGWTRPPEGFVSLNVNASFDADNGTGGTGAIIRDSTGAFIVASASSIPFAEDAATAEARGLKDGLILANNVGCNKVEIQADCMEVMETMQQGGNSEANMAADLLATKSEPSRTIVWQTEAPDFLLDVLSNDLALFSHEK